MKQKKTAEGIREATRLWSVSVVSGVWITAARIQLLVGGYGATSRWNVNSDAVTTAWFPIPGYPVKSESQIQSPILRLFSTWQWRKISSNSAINTRLITRMHITTRSPQPSKVSPTWKSQTTGIQDTSSYLISVWSILIIASPLSLCLLSSLFIPDFSSDSFGCLDCLTQTSRSRHKPTRIFHRWEQRNCKNTCT